MPGRRTPLLLALSLATLLPLATRAESFVGVDLGQSKYSSGPVCYGSGPCDTSDTAWSVRAGYALPFVSLEARYFDLGRARGQQSNSFTSGGSATTVTIPSEFKADGLGAGVQAAVPVLPFFAVTALAGVSRVRARVKISDVTVPGLDGITVTQVGVTGSTTSTQPYYGLGLRFTFAPGFDASLDAQRYRVGNGSLGKADVDFYGVGLTYRY